MLAKAGTKTKIRLALFGAIAFWLPDILFNSLVLYSPHWRDRAVLIAGMLLMPSALFVTWRTQKSANVRPSTAFWMLLGVWVLRPFALNLAFSFQSGSGFRADRAFITFLFSTLLFPIFAFMMSTYDGSLRL